MNAWNLQPWRNTKILHLWLFILQLCIIYFKNSQIEVLNAKHALEVNLGTNKSLCSEFLLFIPTDNL